MPAIRRFDLARAGLAALALLAACTPPFAVKRNVLGAQRQAAASVLTTGELSVATRNLLYENDLTRRYAEDPAGAIAVLHAQLTAGQLRPASVCMLAELAYHHAMHGGGPPYYLAAALYAWTYLFPDDPSAIPGGFDGRLRLVTELYNRGLTQGLAKNGSVDLTPGTRALPFGTLDVGVDPASLSWSGHQLYDFFPLTDIEVSGFPTYYRWVGLGAPLAAKVVPLEGKDADLLAPRARVPVTAVVRPSDLARALRDGTVHASLEVYPGYGEGSVHVNGVDVPLAAEPTAALGLTLAETAVWKQELPAFLQGGVIQARSRLISLRPYRPGLVPVVFVHGTGSSAIRWAELYNVLDNDPYLHDHYQFWFFNYETGNPIIYSAWLLRDSLQHAVAQLDPDGQDPALRRMVVMGHSQGGLLTKMTVVESGDAFWRNISRKPFDEVRLSPDTRELLRNVVFVHPLPFVRRVVFVATPHHGSYVAGNWLAHQVARLISTPASVTRTVTELVTVNRAALVVEGLRGAPTAVDNMTPGNAFVKTLATLPIAPGVAANSIVAVDTDGPPEGKNDGVVEYDSAHLDGVESELVVRSGHSCQANPHTIEEVRRILVKHLELP